MLLLHSIGLSIMCLSKAATQIRQHLNDVATRLVVVTGMWLCSMLVCLTASDTIAFAEGPHTPLVHFQNDQNLVSAGNMKIKWSDAVDRIVECHGVFMHETKGKPDRILIENTSVFAATDRSVTRPEHGMPVSIRGRLTAVLIGGNDPLSQQVAEARGYNIVVTEWKEINRVTKPYLQIAAD